ncbi:MAG TPA: PAS domain S-box protein [Methanospirillum sp.]|nr:PAS domain S-box protein [Methanospirillum sp.]
MAQPIVIKILFMLLIGVLIIGAAYSLIAAVDQDSRMRTQMLTETRIVSAGLSLDQIEGLTGTLVDLKSESYHQMKNYLAKAKAARPQTRFIYLMRENPDGTILFLIDSEPSGSEGYSPPGQVFQNSSDTLRDSFTTGDEAVEGPISDAWGVFVSSLIPLTDSDNKIVAILGMDVDDAEWSNKLFYASAGPAIITILISLVLIIVIVLLERREEVYFEISRSQQALQKSEQQLAKAQDIANLAGWEYDHQTRKIFWSPKIYGILGLSDTISPSRDWFLSMIFPDDRERVAAVYTDVDKCAEPYEVIYRYLHPNGRFIWIQEIGQIETNPEGQFFTVGTIQDITILKEMQRALEEEEERYRLLLGGSNDIVMVLRTNKTISYVSDAVQIILGIDPADLVGSPFPIGRIHPDDQSDLLLKVEALLNTHDLSDRLILRFLHKDGEWIYLEALARSRIADPKINGVIFNIRDVTLIRKMERTIQEYLEELEHQNQTLQEMQRDLIDLNATLEDKVVQRTVEIRALNDEMVERNRQVERLSEQKDLFLYQLAHDLRTPLTPIIGMGPFLMEGISDPDAKELITIFLSSIQYLQKMTEDILTNAQLNRIDALDSYEKFDLGDLITDALDVNKFLAEQKQIKIINEIPPGIFVLFSKPYATLVFRNLINNAVKFNSPRGSIRISSHMTRSTVSVSISDTGIGISPELQNRIWDELYTGDNARQDPLSKGFGLSIVKRIILLHGGSIEVRSDGYLKGSTFIVHISRKEV